VTLFDAASAAGAGEGSNVERESPPDIVRFQLLLAYDGSGFRGFAAQRGQRTVAGCLSEAIAKVVRYPVNLVCAGRTDAGVHARGQVAHVDLPSGTDPDRLAKSLNAMLGPAIVVHTVQVAAPGFDARRSARARRYRYLVLEAPVSDPLLTPVVWRVPGPLELRSMIAASDVLLGEHDFRAFCRRPPGTSRHDPLVRRVLRADWSEVPVHRGDLGEGARLLRFDIAAQSFCHQMVRAIVGELVDVGRGRQTVADLHWLLRIGSRVGAGDLAPAHGLCLVGVDY
jgi:tRNA pseudouridine38-40 synthase